MDSHSPNAWGNRSLENGERGDCWCSEGGFGCGVWRIINILSCSREEPSWRGSAWGSLKCFSQVFAICLCYSKCRSLTLLAVIPLPWPSSSLSDFIFVRWCLKSLLPFQTASSRRVLPCDVAFLRVVNQPAASVGGRLSFPARSLRL